MSAQLVQLTMPLEQAEEIVRELSHRRSLGRGMATWERELLEALEATLAAREAAPTEA